MAEAWIDHTRTDGDAGDYLSAEAAAALSAENGGGAVAAGVQAMVLVNRHQFRATEALAKQTLAKHPDDLRTLAALADAQLELGELRRRRRDGAAHGGPEAEPAELQPRELPALAERGRRDGDEVRAAGVGREPRPRTSPSRARGRCARRRVLLARRETTRARSPGTGRRSSCCRRIRRRCRVKAGRCSRSGGREAAASLKKSFELRPLVETGALWAEAGGEEAVRKTEEEGRRGDAYGLGLFWATRNEHVAEAVALLEKEKGDRPGVYVRDALAWAYYRAGRVADAERELPAVQAPDARLWFHRGAILIAAGKADEGRALVKKALEKNPRWSVREAAEAKKLLGE